MFLAAQAIDDGTFQGGAVDLGITEDAAGVVRGHLRRPAARGAGAVEEARAAIESGSSPSRRSRLRRGRRPTPRRREASGLGERVGGATPRHHQALSGRRRQPRRVPRRRRRVDTRAAGRERRRQVDAHADPVRAGPPRSGDHRGPRSPGRLRRCRRRSHRRHRHGATALQPHRRLHGGREPGPRARARPSRTT